MLLVKRDNAPRAAHDEAVMELAPDGRVTHYSPIGVFRCPACGRERRALLNMIACKELICGGEKIRMLGSNSPEFRERFPSA